MDLHLLTVGDRYNEFAIGTNQIKFDIDDSGALLRVLMVNPTQRELEQYGADKPFRVSFCVLDGVVYLMVKFGDLPWVDAPYHASLSNRLSRVPDIAQGSGTGLGLTVLMANSANGILHQIRFIGLGEDFSGKLLEEAKRQIKNPVTPKELEFLVNKTYNRYTTKKLEEMAKTRWRTDGQTAQPGTVATVAPQRPTVRKSLRDVAHMVRDIKYPGGLPAELEPFHCYVIDGGHSLMCVPEMFLPRAESTGDFDGNECAIPVKYVLEKGHRIVNGYLIVAVPYDEDFGVDLDESYMEF